MFLEAPLCCRVGWMQMPFPTAVFPYGLLTESHSMHSRVFIEHLLCALPKNMEMKDTVLAFVEQKTLRENLKFLGSLTDSCPDSSIHWPRNLIPWLSKLTKSQKPQLSHQQNGVIITPTS